MEWCALPLCAGVASPFFSKRGQIQQRSARTHLTPLGFVDARGPGPSTAPSTDPIPTVHEQAKIEVTPQDERTVENHPLSVLESETERLSLTPDVSPCSVPVFDVDEDQQHDRRRGSMALSGRESRPRSRTPRWRVHLAHLPNASREPLLSL